jgi:hypothetical protein
MATLRVRWADGREEWTQIAVGSEPNARRLPARIGRGLVAKEAQAWLRGEERTAVLINGRYYTRLVR